MLKITKALMLTAIMCLSTSAAAITEKLSPELRIYAQLLISDDTEAVKRAAFSIFHHRIIKQELLDIAAERMYLSLHGKHRLESDTIAWLARAIGQSGSKRYAPVLTEAANYKDLINSSKNHVKRALRSLGMSAPPYKPNELELDKFKTELQQYRDNLPVLAKPLFKQVKLLSDINTVLAKVGEPQKVTMAYNHEGNVLKDAINRAIIELHYKNSGKLHFQFSKNAMQWVLSGILPADKQGKFTGHPMMSNYPYELERYLEALKAKRASLKLQDLDLLAERLMTEYNNELYTNALIIGVKVLARSGSTRYKQTLEYVRDNTQYDDLRSIAKRSLKKLNSGGRGSYQKGDIYKD